jgi:hypothetical protein
LGEAFTPLQDVASVLPIRTGENRCHDESRLVQGVGAA